MTKRVEWFTTLPEGKRTGPDVLDWYRNRWQLALESRRSRLPAPFVSLSRNHGDSVRAWLDGNFPVALLAEHLIDPAASNSPGAITWHLRHPRWAWAGFAFVWNEVYRPGNWPDHHDGRQEPRFHVLH